MHEHFPMPLGILLRYDSLQSHGVFHRRCTSFYTSYPSCSSYNVKLTCLHQEVGSLFPSFQPGQTFVTATISRTWPGWCCVTSTADHKGQCGFCLALFLFNPGTKPPHCEEVQAVWKGHIWLFQLTYPAGLWMIISICQYVSKQAFRWFQPLNLPAEAPDVTEQRQAIPTLSTKTMSNNKWYGYITRMALHCMNI